MKVTHFLEPQSGEFDFRDFLMYFGVMRTMLISVFLLYSLVACSQDNKVDLKKLERSYKSQLIMGGVTMAGAVGCFTGFGLKRAKYEDYAIATGEPKNNYLKEARICLAFGAVLTGISVYSFVKGSKNRRKYIELSSSPSAVSLRVTF